MTTTIPTAFDPTALPKWAQQNPAVVALSKTNYAYRCNVCAAKTSAMRRLLTKQACQ